MSETRDCILAIDQGTTSSRAILYDRGGAILGEVQKPVNCRFPQEGYVEQDPAQLLHTVKSCCQELLLSQKPESLAGIGITNQRETVVVWDKESGEALAPAIVWQDRRTAQFCEELRRDGLETEFVTKTGLCIDPYFSATKIHWLLHNVAGLKKKVDANKVLVGTVDSFLLWHLSETRAHSTDATNASRTQIFNIAEQQWDEELCAIFSIPQHILPKVKDSAADFGTCHIGGYKTKILSMIGDQQSSLIGQGCHAVGMAKCTYGTGAFLMANTGSQPLMSSSGLLTTVAMRLNGQTSFALEGSIFAAGSLVNWLRDGLGIIDKASDTQALMRASGDSSGVWVVPALTGLGAPWWKPGAEGLILGLKLDSDKKDIVTAAMSSICFQTKDLIQSLTADSFSLSNLSIDGGMAQNPKFAQLLADTLGCTIQRWQDHQRTAAGARALANYQAGLSDSVHSSENAKNEACTQIEADKKWSQVKGEKNYQNWRRLMTRLMDVESALFPPK